jgi:hypothetical protein
MTSAPRRGLKGVTTIVRDYFTYYIYFNNIDEGSSTKGRKKYN